MDYLVTHVQLVSLDNCELYRDEQIEKAELVQKVIGLNLKQAGCRLKLLSPYTRANSKKLFVLCQAQVRHLFRALYPHTSSGIITLAIPVVATLGGYFSPAVLTSILELL